MGSPARTDSSTEYIDILAEVDVSGEQGLDSDEGADDISSSSPRPERIRRLVILYERLKTKYTSQQASYELAIEGIHRAHMAEIASESLRSRELIHTMETKYRLEIEVLKSEVSSLREAVEDSKIRPSHEPLVVRRRPPSLTPGSLLSAFLPSYK